MKKKSAQQKPHDMVYGAHAVSELLKAKRRKLYSIYTTKPLPKSWSRVKKYLPKVVPNTQYVSRDQLDRMAGSSEHQSIVALVSPFQYAKHIPTPEKHPFILLLDAVQDVRNLGAILRSAYCTGITSVVLCKSKSASVTPAVLKASAGLAEHLHIYQAASIKHAVQELKNAGYTLYMAVMEGHDVTQASFKKPLCLVIGNEEIGIQKDVQAAGELITIPQVSSDVSYNASVAAGILLFWIKQKIR